ncbi:MAG: hypothetical protein E7001_04655 [Coriobacteriaceae bacterium]|nr:hypothetical protein [Coriobacteriaceae bacterium]
MDDTNKTTPGTSSPDAPSPLTPTFLTREEYENMGDDPEPLPKGFEVIDGTGVFPRVEEDEPQEDPAADAGEEGAVAAVRSFFSQGAHAVRQVSAAKKAHETARSELSELEEAMSERTAELEHRRDITARFDEIIATETARKQTANEDAVKADATAKELADEISGLKDELQQMKDADTQTERRLKAAVEAAEAKEASARESGSRLQRRLDDARRNLERAESERETGIRAAEAAIKTAEERLQTLRGEFTEIQRNPSANSAAYSVRLSELEQEISDAREGLRTAEADLPRVTGEVEQTLTTARALVVEAEKPIDAAKTAFRAITEEADAARDELDRAKLDAQGRQRDLREHIASQEKRRREQVQAAEDARETASEAEAAIAEATDIHDHPELIEELERRLSADEGLRAQKQAEVEALADTERTVRESTRGSRVRFIGAIAGAVAVVVLIVVLWMVFSRP